jgi:hypothetical protein
MRRGLLRVLCLLSLFLLPGCALTSGLAQWGRQLEEPVSAVLMSADHRQIVLIGRYRHYVLDEMEAGLAALLAQEALPGLQANGAELRMEADGRIKGRFFMVADPARLGEAEAAALRAAGYRASERDARLYRAFDISGRAFRPGSAPVLPPATFSPAFTLHLRKPAEHWQNALKLPLSPVTLTADAGIVMAGVALVIPTYVLVCTYGTVTGTAGGFCSSGG